MSERLGMSLVGNPACHLCANFLTNDICAERRYENICSDWGLCLQ